MQHDRCGTFRDSCLSRSAAVRLAGWTSMTTFLIVPLNRLGATYSSLTGEPESSPMSKVSSAEYFQSSSWC